MFEICYLIIVCDLHSKIRTLRIVLLQANIDLVHHSSYRHLSLMYSEVALRRPSWSAAKTQRFNSRSCVEWSFLTFQVICSLI